jgi:branched-chain amino acid transport system ATP-binding protein
MAEAILEAKQIRGGYGGGVDILNGISTVVHEGEIVSIIGPNGAGKSTLMKALFGLLNVSEGSVYFAGQEITGLRPDQIVRRGLCYVPQEYNVFPTLTVNENLEMGAFVRNDDFRPQMDTVYELFPPLKEKRRQQAGKLSGGQRQMVAIGRALMLNPSMLMLDEPSAGLSPLFVDQIFDRVQKINSLGVAILMVEQNAKRALALSHRGYVLVMGRNRHHDEAEKLLHDPDVAEMFLGG